MADVDFGTDFHSFPDFDFNLSTISGPPLVVEASMNRLRTARGGLWYDRDYGTDVRQFVNSSASPKSIARAVETEVEKDERVASASATVTREGQNILIVLRITTASGAFTLTIAVSALTVDLIDFSEAA
jgi:hypothetical protein